MALKLSDLKKVIRGQGEARQIYPHQIRDDRYTAAIGFALDYYRRMAGRRRAEFEVDALLEFFGDPRLARGLVACLAATYTWRSPSFAEALGAEAAEALDRAGVRHPAQLRARLYALANGRYGGFIAPSQRDEALAALAGEVAGPVTNDHRPSIGERLATVRRSESDMSRPGSQPGDTQAHEAPPGPPSFVVRPTIVERALHLDAEEEYVLTRISAPPSPQELVARYNYHSLETALCYAEQVQLRMHGPVWAMLRSAHNLARRYRIGYSVGDLPGSLFDERLELTLHGRRDALGGWGRAGRRLTRALLRLIAAHPGCASAGSAVVHIGERKATLRLDERALTMLGATWSAANPAGDAWEDQSADELQRAWSRAQARGKTGGWGLRRDPEPLVGAAAVLLPDFVARRGGQSVALCLATSRAMAETSAAAIEKLGPSLPIVALAPESAAAALKRGPATVVLAEEDPADNVARLAAALDRIAPPAKAARTA